MTPSSPNPSATFYDSHYIDLRDVRRNYATLTRIHNANVADPSDAIALYKGSGFGAANRMLRARRHIPELSIYDLFAKLATKIKTHGKKMSQQSIYEIQSELERTAIECMNNTLRMINKLDSYLGQQHLKPIPFALFRGITLYTQTHKVGDVVEFPNFLSTSVDPQKAWNFSNADSHGAMFVLHVRDNAIPWSLTQIRPDKKDDEWECLLPRNTRWKVLRKYKTCMHPKEVRRFSMRLPRTKEKERIVLTHTHQHPMTVYELSSLPYQQPEPFKLLITDLDSDMVGGVTDRIAFDVAQSFSCNVTLKGIS